jgi:hypothetical protein
MNLFKDFYDFGIWIIKILRTPIPVYIIVSRDYIKVINLENGQTASEFSERKFSTSRLLIADTIVAENFAMVLLNRVCSATQLRTRSLKVVCHPLDNELSNLSPVEKMIFTDFVVQIGGRHIRIISNEKELTVSELKLKYYS